jgi:hypothetical protein
MVPADMEPCFNTSLEATPALLISHATFVSPAIDQ